MSFYSDDDVDDYDNDVDKVHYFHINIFVCIDVFDKECPCVLRLCCAKVCFNMEITIL